MSNKGAKDERSSDDRSQLDYILELDLEYGHPPGAQVKIRAEDVMEMLESRAG